MVIIHDWAFEGSNKDTNSKHMSAADFNMRNQDLVSYNLRRNLCWCTTHVYLCILAAADSRGEQRQVSAQTSAGLSPEKTVILDVCFPMLPQGSKCAQLKLSWGWILEVCPWNETRHQHWPRRWNYTPYNTLRTSLESKYPVKKTKQQEDFHIIN